MNFLGKLAVTGLALSVSSFASAAISGSTDFRVILPEILVLYHWDDAVLTLNDVADTAISDVTPRTGSVNIGQTTASITGNPVATDAAIVTNIAVTLKDSWAVRSLSSANGVSLALTNPNTNLLNVANNNSVIKTSKAVLSSDSATVTGKNTATLGIPSGFAAVSGDITFDLDLTAANNAGEYNTRGTTGKAANDAKTDTFLLTLTGL